MRKILLFAAIVALLMPLLTVSADAWGRGGNRGSYGGWHDGWGYRGYYRGGYYPYAAYYGPACYWVRRGWYRHRVCY